MAASPAPTLQRASQPLATPITLAVSRGQGSLGPSLRVESWRIATEIILKVRQQRQEENLP